jgi:uncharacterized membrane protein YfcA
MDFLHQWIVPPEATVEPWKYVLTAFVALMIMAVSKGGFGGGVGIISVPMMLYVAPTQFVLGSWVPLLVVCDLATIHQYPKEWNPRAFLKLAPGVMLGIILVTVVVRGIDPTPHSKAAKQLDRVLRIGAGAVSLVFVLLQLRPKGPESAEAWKPTWLVAIPTGLTAGITTMIANAAGPIITMFLLPQKMDQRVFVGTCGRFYFIFNTIKIPFAIACGWATWSTFHYSVWMMVLGPLGVFMGVWLNKRISAAWFVRLVQFSLIFAGIKLVYDGLKA